MTQFIDTHSHIHEADVHYNDSTESRERWQKAGITDADALVADGKAAGVVQMICIGTTLQDSTHAIDFAARHDGAWATIGLHPHEAATYADDQTALDAFAALATKPKVVGVGECGLDYYYEHSPREAQIRLLRFQLELAQKHHLPLSFHVREAFEDFWPIFDEFHARQPLRGVLHSFTDNVANMQAAVKRGLYIGINGIATFNKTPELLTVHQTVPIERILLETDAPFLTPAPERGKVCTPKHVVLTAKFLGELRNVPTRELSHATIFNSKELFGI